MGKGEGREGEVHESGVRAVGKSVCGSGGQR